MESRSGDSGCRKKIFLKKITMIHCSLDFQRNGGGHITNFDIVMEMKIKRGLMSPLLKSLE